MSLHTSTSYVTGTPIVAVVGAEVLVSDIHASHACHATTFIVDDDKLLDQLLL